MKIRRLYRRFLSNKSAFLLNIGTLVLGLVSFIYIINYVYIHQNFDNHWTDYEHIYKINTRIYKDGKLANHWPSAPIKLGPELKANFPEIEECTRYSFVWEASVVSNKITSTRVRNIIYADTNFFKIFDHKVLEGDLDNALRNPNSIVITKSMKDMYFPNSNPIGEVLHIHNDKLEVQKVFVTAVIEDMPDNTEMVFDMAGSLEGYIAIQPDWLTGWAMHASFTYLKLKPGTNVQDLENKFDEVVDIYLGEFARTMGRRYEYYLSNISELHYIKDFSIYDSSTAISRTSLTIMMYVAFIILLVSFINNLSFQVSQIHTRLKNLGLQKIIGSKKRTLFAEFVWDSFLINTVALLVAYVMFQILSPYLNHIVLQNITNVQLNTLKLWFIILGVFTATSVLIAMYPAYVITRVNPLHILQRRTDIVNPRSNIKKGMVSFQFGATIFMIIASIVIYKQKHYMVNQTHGFNSSNVLVVKSPMTTGIDAFVKQFSAFKNECMSISGVNNVTYTSNIPGDYAMKSIYENPVKSESLDSYSFIESDYSYLPLLKTTLIAGRNFSNNESDMNSIVINETACLAFGFENAQKAIGGTIFGNNMSRTIIGVVEDYNHLSPKNEISPHVYFIGTTLTRFFMIDLETDYTALALRGFQDLYTQFFPDNPFDYSFLEDEYSKQYRSENQLGALFIIFSIVAIAISCLGLIGLTLVETKLRIKEIGIRKVNGARITEILSVLNRDYLKWVILAFAMATPLAWYAMQMWLQGFAQQTNLSWWIFALAGILVAIIAVVTTSWQSWRAASSNPVQALRYE